MSVQPYETKHKIWGYDCGYGGPFSPLALANYFQEIAGNHAYELGVGMGAMFAKGQTWMLSRIDIEIEDLPREGDEILLRTWPAGTDRIFALRYIEMYSALGKRLAGALYDYMIVDMEKRRPLRPERLLDPAMKADLPAPYPDLSTGIQHLEGFAGFSGGLSDGWAESFRLNVGNRHIDYNGHVNNAHFINWLCDAIPMEERGSGRLSRLKVDFVSEVKLGEEVAAFWNDDEASGGKLSLLTRGGEVVARGFTRWCRVDVL